MFLLTSYHALQGALEVQVRLRSGEVYDQVSMMAFDERRDVAALHISAQGLTSLPPAASTDAVPGDKIHLLTASGNPAWTASEGVLGQTRLADDVPGAGRGYRVTEFTAVLPPNALGGALINSRGQFLGILTGSPNSAGNQFAIPLETVAGLSGEGRLTALGSGKNLVLPALPSHSGPAEHEQPASDAALAQAQSLRVTSSTTFLSPFMLEKELMANSQFLHSRAESCKRLSRRGFADQRGPSRCLFTYDFTFSVTSAQSGVLLLTEKVTAIDGPHAAQDIAHKLVKALQEARALKAADQSGWADLSSWL